MKPMLASDWDESQQLFPVIAQPKIDGVRGLRLNGPLTGRSLKPHKNILVTEAYSSLTRANGFDGEITYGRWLGPRVCSITTGLLNSPTRDPVDTVTWHIFDLILPHTRELPYSERYDILRRRIEDATSYWDMAPFFVKLMPSQIVYNMKQLLKVEREWLDAGYEGVCLRDPDGLVKEGRSTVREGGLLRIKRFVDEEGTVTELIEGETNNNEPTVNELGKTARSSHRANKESNGMVGSLRVLRHKTGQIVTISAGCMSAGERRQYFLHPESIVGKVVKFQHFPYGAKDELRFATFQSIRAKSDIS